MSHFWAFKTNNCQSNTTMSIPIAVIEIPDEEERKLRAKTPDILEITELDEKPIQKVALLLFLSMQLF